MDRQTTKANQARINQEILDCINKLKSLKLFSNNILSPAEEYSLLKDSQSKDSKISKKATDQLIRSFFKLGFKEAMIKFNIVGRKVNFEDLLSETSIGILTAIKKFNLERWGKENENGVKLRFSTYAKWWIKNNLSDYCLKNSSCIKFCTTKDDEIVFYNINSIIKEIAPDKQCCELNKNEISKIAQQLKVNEKNVRKYINSINISYCENDLEKYFIEKSYQNSIDDQEKLNKKIDKENILSEFEKSVYNEYTLGNGLEFIAKKFKSNKETIRQILIISTKKINPEKKII